MLMVLSMYWQRDHYVFDLLYLFRLSRFSSIPPDLLTIPLLWGKVRMDRHSLQVPLTWWNFEKLLWFWASFVHLIDILCEGERESFFFFFVFAWSEAYIEVDLPRFAFTSDSSIQIYNTARPWVDPMNVLIVDHFTRCVLNILSVQQKELFVLCLLVLVLHVCLSERKM